MHLWRLDLVSLPAAANANVHRYRRPIQRWGVPFDGLTDNGKQFTGKLARPLRIEVLFERTCREYGITRPPDQTAITVPRTRGYTHTNGKIEQFHRTLRRELLDEVGAFATIEEADRDRRMDSRLQHASPSSVVGHGARRACSGHDRTKNRLLLPPRSSVWAHRSPRNRS